MTEPRNDMRSTRRAINGIQCNPVDVHSINQQIQSLLPKPGPDIPAEPLGSYHSAATPSGSQEHDNSVDGEASESIVPGKAELDDGSWLAVEDQHYKTTEYFGKGYTKHIKELHSAEPMLKPTHMITTPHPHQCHGAGQMNFRCRSVFRGLICGDEMGTGKTLMTVMAMIAAFEETGCFSLVVCPSGCRNQWKDECQKNFEPGRAPKVFVLSDPKITAHQLLAAKFEIVIVSFEFLQARHKAMKTYMKATEEERARMKRPTSALHSEIYKLLALPIKRLVIDEAHKAKNVLGARHEALMELYFSAAICLSGTFLDNEWCDVYGLLAFLSGHPFQRKEDFMNVFGVKEADHRYGKPNDQKLVFLQKLLMATAIARPATFLNLPGLKKFNVRFSLTAKETVEVNKSVAAYRRACRNAHGKRNEGLDSMAVLFHAVRAMQWSQHPLLVAASNISAKNPDDSDEESEEDEDGDYQASGGGDDSSSDDSSDSGSEPDDDELTVLPSAQSLQDATLLQSGEFGKSAKREEWKKMATSDNPRIYHSSRLLCIQKLYAQIRESKPDKKIMIFSTSLKFLDLVGVLLLDRFEISAIRYDGTISNEFKRDATRAEFKGCDPSIPLLITAGAGGTGLNFPEASIIIQCELWWNGNNEKQAVGRAHRQGQAKEVEWYRLDSESAIDIIMRKKQESKLSINDAVMGPIFRDYDEPPRIPEVA